MNHLALRDISYGLYVVTSRSGEKLNGQIANAVFQASALPEKIAVCLNKENLTHQCILDSGCLTVSVLEEQTPMTFIGTFGFKSGRDVDKFAGVSWITGATGCPVVTDHSLSYIEARVISTSDAGTHTVFLADIVAAEVLKPGRPLTYAYYHEVKNGTSPKNAPTWDAGKPAQTEPPKESAMQKYVCNICGYIYDPDQGDEDGNIVAGTPFEDLPESWACPVCGAGKDEFSPED